MPGSFPMGIEVCNAQDAGTLTASSDGTTITASGSTNTKGSWTQLVASLGADCCWVLIEIGTPNTGVRKILVDIGVGAAASEQVVVSNLQVLTQSSGTGDDIKFSFPLQIPAGSRVSARSQSATASAAVTVKMTCFDGAFTMMEGVAGLDMLGVSTATSVGTNVTPSATANTKGSFAQLIASTARDYCGLVVVVGPAGTAGDIYLVDIAIGAAASEQVIIPNVRMAFSTTITASPIYIPMAVPAGTRISARAQASAASGTATVVAVGGLYA